MKFVRVFGVRSITTGHALVGLKTQHEAETIKYTWETVHGETCKLMFYKVPEAAMRQLPTTYYGNVEKFYEIFRSGDPAYYLPRVSK